MHSSNAICKMIAHKMQHPLQVSECILEVIQQKLPLKKSPELTLAYGLPGITCFYAMMDSSFPREGWNHVTHAYIQLIAEKLKVSPPLGCSLFEGLSGVCFALYVAFKQGSENQRLLEELDLLLLRKIEQDFIHVGNQYLHHHSTPPLSFYNLSEGIAGILAYLTLRQDHIFFQKSVLDLISILKQLIPKTFLSLQNPSQKYSKNTNKTSSPYDPLLFSIRYGLPGLLASLSLTKSSNNTELQEVLKKVANWIKDQHKLSPLGGIQWPHTDPFILKQNHSSIEKECTDNWCYGAPSISRSLYLSAQALEDSHLKTFSQDSFCSLFLRDKQDWNLRGPSFSIGHAGLLTLVHAMAQNTNNPFLWNKVQELEHDLKCFYTPDHLFGFQSPEITSESRSLGIYDPGLLDGTAGIGLSLLLRSHPNQKIWQRLFLINSLF